MKIFRWVLVIGIIFGAILVAGYRLSQFEVDADAAVPDPAPVKASLTVQATTIQEVEARGAILPADRSVVFEDNAFGYQLTYPFDWDQVELSSTIVSFQSPDGATEVKVESVGPLPTDGLGAFVNRSLGGDIVISRQLLTVHSQPAERVIAYSDLIGDQVTTFYIDGGKSVFVVTGVGQQKAIETVARSFTMPQLLAQR